MKELIPQERIEQKIFMIRDQKVMLDRDLAALYAIPTKALKQAVRRNLDRFPVDFMFILNDQELASWRSQFVTSNADRMGLRYPPMAFTEQGVAMLSSVLKSRRAVQVNIAIMRVFVKLRDLLSTHKELACKLAELERKIERHDGEIRSIFEAIRQLMAPMEQPKRRIGFHTET
jgi:hypothetical protein